MGFKQRGWKECDRTCVAFHGSANCLEEAQCLMCLSLCESECVVISEVVKEAQFASKVLDDMGTHVQLPMSIFVDNNGAMEMVRNNKGVTGLRHVNVQHCCVWELHGQSAIAIIFENSSDNKADTMTKDVTRQEFEKHSPKLVDKMPEELLMKPKEKEGCQNAC